MVRKVINISEKEWYDSLKLVFFTLFFYFLIICDIDSSSNHTIATASTPVPESSSLVGAGACIIGVAPSTSIWWYFAWKLWSQCRVSCFFLNLLMSAGLAVPFSGLSTWLLLQILCWSWYLPHQLHLLYSSKTFLTLETLFLQSLVMIKEENLRESVLADYQMEMVWKS